MPLAWTLVIECVSRGLPPFLVCELLQNKAQASFHSIWASTQPGAQQGLNICLVSGNER